MLSWIRRRTDLVRESRDAGITLMELVVAMALFSIIGAMTLALFLTVNSSTAATTDRSIGSAQARNILQSWTAYLRVSDVPRDSSCHAIDNGVRFERVTAKDLLFYANLGNPPASGSTCFSQTLIWLRLDTTGALVEEQFTPVPTSFPAAPTVCRVLATNVQAATLFSSSPDATVGTLPKPSAGCQQLPPLTHPTGSALQGISTITIDFTIVDSRGTRSQDYTSAATVPDLGGAA